VVRVALVVKIAVVHLDGVAADVAHLGVPRDLVANLEGGGWHGWFLNVWDQPCEAGNPALANPCQKSPAVGS